MSGFPRVIVAGEIRERLNCHAGNCGGSPHVNSHRPWLHYSAGFDVH
jgi:hypothetical protein